MIGFVCHDEYNFLHIFQRTLDMPNLYGFPFSYPTFRIFKKTLLVYTKKYVNYLFNMIFVIIFAKDKT